MELSSFVVLEIESLGTIIFHLFVYFGGRGTLKVVSNRMLVAMDLKWQAILNSLQFLILCHFFHGVFTNVVATDILLTTQI